MKQAGVRIGIDWGGTKIEALAMDADGQELRRLRIPTPRHDYEGSIRAAVELVASIERDVGPTGPIGVGIPGSIVPATDWSRMRTPPGSMAGRSREICPPHSAARSAA